MIQRVPRTWVDESTSPKEAGELARHFSLPLPIAEVMVRRGIRDLASAETFLDPRLERLSDPLLLPNMGPAVDRIWKALLSGERILVFGDYDVDGVTSTALLSNVLQGLGGIVSRYIPHRIDDGYGLGRDVLEICLEKFRPALIVTVDCGTGSVEAVTAAKAVGVDVIVTDHHESSGAIAPALAVVNPKLGPESGLHTLAGVGVAFKLCHALIKVGRVRNIPISSRLDMRSLMHLVALGTVADMVPLIGENRILARFGISVLNKRHSPGIDALARSAGVQQTMTSYHIGFVLGPRINAAGRMDSPDLALNLLLAKSLQEAEPLAEVLEVANKERQAIEQAILEDAVSEIDQSYDPTVPSVIVVARRSWHAGVVGIVASRLVRRYHRPAIVISIGEDGVGRGSCRSIDGFDLITHLTAMERFLRQYGGHRMAAGLDIEESQIPAFREAICEQARTAMAHEDLRPRQHIDGWISPGDLQESFMAAQDQLMPFGHENTTPVWGIRQVIPRQWQVVGGGKHVRLILDTPHGPRDAIGFGMGEREKPEGPVDLAFQLRRNVFRGEEKLQLMLQDFR